VLIITEIGGFIGVVQSICHPFATHLPPQFLKSLLNKEKGVNTLNNQRIHSQYFIYDVFACVVFSKRSTERPTIFSVSCT